MILQALHGYYERRMRDPDPARRLPVTGLEEKEIPFVLELARDGRLVAVIDTRTVVGKKKTAKRFLVPQGVKRTVGVAANLLWDTAEYVLGLDTKGKPERVVQQTAAFRSRIDALALSAPEDGGLEAVKLFLANQPLAAVQAHALWPEIAEGNPLLTFRLAGDLDLVCQRPAVVSAILSGVGATVGNGSYLLPCLVTGQSGSPELLHSAIKGVWGAQTAGANIVSFNLDAFRSFGKEQGANAPVSAAAAFAYTTALNSLLAKGSRQRMQVGDASTVFWRSRIRMLTSRMLLRCCSTAIAMTRMPTPNRSVRCSTPSSLVSSMAHRGRAGSTSSAWHRTLRASPSASGTPLRCTRSPCTFASGFLISSCSAARTTRSSRRCFAC